MNDGTAPPMDAPEGTAPTGNAGAPFRLPALALAVAAGALALAGAAYWFFVAAPAQKEEPKTIGMVYFRQQLDSIEGFKQEMEKLGYKDIVYKEAQVFPGPTMADDIEKATREIVDEGVDLIFASIEHHVPAALKVTAEKGQDTPIVFMTRFHDPVEYGLIASYKSSGNNATGVATNMIEIVQKTLGFLKEINPDMKKLGVFGAGFTVPEVAARYFAEVKNQAPKFGIKIVEYTTAAPPPEAEKAWHEVAATIKPGDIDALFHLAGHFYEPQEAEEYKLAKRLKIPHAVPSEDLHGGGHFAYADDNRVSGEQAAAMADKIFKGTKPSDIPVEFGSRSTLILNLARARETGITFPDSMLFIAETKIDE